jgi:hypothetical protein
MASVRHLGLFPYDQKLGVSCWSSSYIQDEDENIPDTRMSLAKAMCLFWQVASFEFDCPWNGLQINTQLIGLGNFSSSEFTPSSELDLLRCDLYLDKRKTVGSFETGDSLLEINLRQASSFNPLGPVLFLRGSKPQPEPNEDLLYAWSTDPFNGANAAVGAIDFSFGPQGTSRYYSKQITVYGESGSSPVSGSITATAYWPYDPGDGQGPIYDSTTGEQLRPFPST